MACQSGFLQRIRIISPYLSCKCCTVGVKLRNDSDPFLSFRSNATLNCLLYKHIQSALKSSAKHFNLDGAWFNTQSIRMSVPMRTNNDHPAHGSLENSTVLNEMSGIVYGSQWSHHLHRQQPDLLHGGRHLIIANIGSTSAQFQANCAEFQSNCATFLSQ